MFEDFKTLLVEQMNIDEADITPDAELVADLGINSLELADLVFSCESKYNIEIDEDLMFCIDSWVKTETEIFTEWYRLGTAPDPEKAAHWLVSIIPPRLYEALKM